MYSLPYLAQQIVNGLTLGSIYALVAIGLTIVYGILQLINFAHGDLLMLGAYLALGLLVNTALPLGAAVLLPMIVVGGVGMLVERLAYRPPSSLCSDVPQACDALVGEHDLASFATCLTPRWNPSSRT